MRYTIGAKLERYDREGYVKPFFYNLPYSPEVDGSSFYKHGISERVIDSKCFGIMFDFFYALSKQDETDIQLDVITSDKKEKHDGYIELEKLYDDYCDYEVHGLNNYKGEHNLEYHGPAIDLRHLYNIPNPKYIYLKKL